MSKKVFTVVFAAAAVVTSSFAGGAVAQESKKSASNWSCEEFLAVDASFQPKAVYYVSGLTRGGKLDTLEDIQGTEKIIPMVIDECKKMPKDSLKMRLKSAWRAVKGDAATQDEAREEPRKEKHGKKHKH